MPPQLVQWPDAIIELNKELASGFHPKLEAILSALPGESNFIERFGAIAAYVEVALDGMYTSDQMIAMVDRIFLDRLKTRRENPNQTIIVH